MTLAELSEASGIPARTIRFYIARGLVDGPGKAGRGAEYSDGHLARLEEIKALQAKGKSLAEIAHAAATPVPPAAAWFQHIVDDDVMIFVRAGASPWRMKQIRGAIDEMAAQLRERKDQE